MNTKRLTLMGITILLFSLLIGGSRVRADSDTTFKWVIPDSASALAADGSVITLTGSGTFHPGDSEEVTGGGSWTVSTGGSGTYNVTGLVRFDLAPGSVPGVPSIHAGLAFLRIAYSDGSRGILAVNCMLPGTPANVSEGITASKDFVDYFNLQPAGTFFRKLSGN